LLASSDHKMQAFERPPDGFTGELVPHASLLALIESELFGFDEKRFFYRCSLAASFPVPSILLPIFETIFLSSMKSGETAARNCSQNVLGCRRVRILHVWCVLAELIKESMLRGLIAATKPASWLAAAAVNCIFVKIYSIGLICFQWRYQTGTEEGVDWMDACTQPTGDGSGGDTRGGIACASSISPYYIPLLSWILRQ